MNNKAWQGQKIEGTSHTGTVGEIEIEVIGEYWST